MKFSFFMDKLNPDWLIRWILYINYVPNAIKCIHGWDPTRLDEIFLIRVSNWWNIPIQFHGIRRFITGPWNNCVCDFLGTCIRASPMGQMHSMFWLMNNTNTTWWAASTQIILFFLLPKFSERINIFMLKIQSRQPDLNPRPVQQSIKN